MKDPYEILGVSRDATDAQIKEAYRNLAKKFHPDNYANSPLADLAKEKMQEINVAYDTIQKERKEGKSSFGNMGGGQYSTNSRYPKIRQLINARDFLQADALLEEVSKDNRDAEWHFLKGCIYLSRGWYFEAEASFIKATQMDPSNLEYQSALSALKNRSAGFNTRARGTTTTRTVHCSTCDICTGLLCADCCCECIGCDLIRCC